MSYLRSTRSFLAPEAVSLNTPDDVVAGAPGESTEIAFLALATLVVGADAAVDGNGPQTPNAVMHSQTRPDRTRAGLCNAATSQAPSISISPLSCRRGPARDGNRLSLEPGRLVSVQDRGRADQDR
jgi:hypothetical protein